MIDRPATDILTPITGEVGKTTTHDHSATAEVSFLSVITAEDADADALTTGPDQPLVSQMYPNPKTGHVGLAAAFPARGTASGDASEVVPDTVLLVQDGQPLPPNQLESSSTPPILREAVMDADSGDVQPALIGDARQIGPATPSDSKMIRRNGPGTTPSTTIEVPAPIRIPNGAINEPVTGKEAAAIVMDPGTADLSPITGNLTGQPLNGVPVAAQYNIADPTGAANAGFPDTVFPKVPANSSEGALPLVASSKVSLASQEKQAIAQQTPNAPQTQSGRIEPMNVSAQPAVTESAQAKAIAPNSVPAPVQASAPRSTRTPTVDLPVSHAASGRPAGDQKTALKTDVAQPDPARPPAIQSSQTAPEATTTAEMPRPEMPWKDIQTPAQGGQSQAKQPPEQPTEAAPMQPAQPPATQLPPAGLTPQATLSPTADRHAVKLNRQPTPVSQTRVPSKDNSAQPASPSVMGPMVPLTETTTAEALDTLSTPGLLPFEAKSADIPSIIRHDANINRPEVMRHVAQQLTDVARQMPDRPVELILNPEELGRVRLTFRATDGGIHVAVMVERGETMDLLRRHIETLAQEFREMGYKDVNFEFSHNGQNEAQNGETDAQSSGDSDAAPASTQMQTLAPVQLSLEPSAGLDLRL